MFVAIEGCIAAGKSTTARMLADTLGLQALLEQTSVHPFLDSFYADPDRYALETELGFVLLHYHQLHPLGAGIPVIADFSPVKDLVFARMNLSGNDLALFEHLYADLINRIPKPKIAIFLDPPIEELVRRMLERKRPYETNVPVEYLRRLRKHYDSHMDELAEEVRVVKVVPGECRETVAEKVLEIARPLMGRES